MRISSAFQYEVFSQQMQSTNSDYFNAEQQVATGKQFTNGYQDPAGANRLVSLNSMMATYQQANTNQTAANDYLNNNESVFSSMTNLMNSVQQVAIQGASSAADPTTQASLANQVTDLEKQLVDLGNTQGASGQYIFAGQDTKNAPFSASGGTLTYTGDNLPVNIEVQPGNKMQVNASGAGSLLTSMYSTLETLKSNLQSGNIQAISTTSLAAIKTNTTQLAQIRAINGVKMQDVKSYQTSNQQRIDDLTASISNTQDVDMATAVTNYQRTQVAYQAALQVTSQVGKLSLMNYL